MSKEKRDIGFYKHFNPGRNPSRPEPMKRNYTINWHVLHTWLNVIKIEAWTLMVEIWPVKSKITYPNAEIVNIGPNGTPYPVKKEVYTKNLNLYIPKKEENEEA